jgi:molybdopterin/thiamine biosynthesis adenylyltransferase
MSRYWQQIIVPEIGAEGQQKLAAAKVLIIGAGGLGTPVAVYLAAAGVGTIGIADGDTVALSNLSRQFLYDETNIGQSKAIVLAAKLAAQNAGITINPHEQLLNEANSSALIGQYNVICDCTDNAEARILINTTCGQLNKPLVYAVVKDWEGYVTVLHHTKKVSLEHIFSTSSLLENAALNCSVAGIVNTTCGIAGSNQACEVLKVIFGVGSELDGGILCFNSFGPLFRVFRLKG